MPSPVIALPASEAIAEGTLDPPVQPVKRTAVQANIVNFKTRDDDILTPSRRTTCPTPGQCVKNLETGSLGHETT